MEAIPILISIIIITVILIWLLYWLISIQDWLQLKYYKFRMWRIKKKSKKWSKRND